MHRFTAILIILTLSVCAFGGDRLQAGSMAPDFVGNSIEGKSLSLSAMQGKVVVLTFWSTRCAICHSEIPKLNRVADRYRGKDVVFLALTMENEAKVQPYINKNPFNFDIVPNSFGVFLKYADKDSNGNISMGFPAHFVLNKRGQIVMRTDGWDKASTLDSQIAKSLSD